MARVLVTYGWCRTSYLIARSLAARGHQVYACSSRRPAAALWSRYTRRGAVVRDPFEEPEAFVEDVAALVRRWGIDAIFPGHEDAIPLQRLAERLPDGVTLVSPSGPALVHAVDKGEMTRTAIAAGLTVPETAFPEDTAAVEAAAERIGYPVVLKLRRSNGGKGVLIAEDREDVRAAFAGPWAALVDQPGQEPIVQRFVTGTVLGACFLAAEGAPVAVYGERYLRTKDAGFGTSTYRSPEPSAALREATTTLVRALGWTGLGHLDFLEETGSGQLHFLELNPRPWGAIHLAYVNGFDFPAAAVAQALDEEDLERYFPSDQDHGTLHSLWLVGEGKRLVSQLAARRGRRRDRPHRPTQQGRVAWRVARPDGFVWHDPGAFVAECACYLGEYVRAGGDVNPHTDGMLRQLDRRPHTT